jgi:hypothetical protein
MIIRIRNNYFSKQYYHIYLYNGYSVIFIVGAGFLNIISMKCRLQLESRNSFTDTQASEHYSGPAILELNERRDGRTDGQKGKTCYTIWWVAFS